MHIIAGRCSKPSWLCVAPFSSIPGTPMRTIGRRRAGVHGTGAREEAIREQMLAANLNPVSPIAVGNLGWQQYLRGEYELSRSSMEPAVDLSSDFEEGHAGLACAAARLGDESTVMTTIAAGLARRGDLRGDLLAEQASALAILGESCRARELAREATEHPALPINLALAWARALGRVKRHCGISLASRFGSTGHRRRSGGIRGSI